MEKRRRIQVFIVTLFVDDGPGTQLRGRLRPVSNDLEAHFSQGEELLGLLRQAAADPEPLQPGPDATAPT